MMVLVTASAQAAPPDSQRPSYLTFFSNLDLEDPRQLPMKLRSLSRDAYTYFRGSAAEFYQLAGEGSPDWLADTTTWVQLHGDVHIGNVGTYQGPGQPGRDIHFGVVDLDETILGPFQLDLLRALTSVRFAAELGGSKPNDVSMRQAAKAMCQSYTKAVAGEDGEAELVLRHEAAALLVRKAQKNEIHKYIGRYADLSPEMRFKKARIKDGAVRDILEPVDDKQKKMVIDAVWNYLRSGTSAENRKAFRYEREKDFQSDVRDVARWTRVESSGSQGIHKYLVLLENPLRESADPLILELKEQPKPAAAVAGILKAQTGAARATDVAGGYDQLMRPAPRLVGFTQMDGRGFLVRTKDPWGEELEPGDFRMHGNAEGVVKAASLLGDVVGMAHRNSLATASKPQQVALLCKKAEELEKWLCERSKVIHEQMAARYAKLAADDGVKALVKKADEFIQEFDPK